MTSEQLYEFLQTRWREPTGLQLSINSLKLKEIIPELQDSDRVLLTGSSGGYKTTLTFRVVVDLISYALKNPDKTDVLVLYNVIEIPITEMYIKFIQYLFYKKLNKIYSRDRILNRNHTNKDEELEKDFLLISKYIDAFNTKIRFVRLFTPSEFGNYCVKILDDLHEIKIVDGKKVVGKRKNPKLKVLVVSDTTDSYSADERLKLNKQESVKYWHKYYTNKILGNTYGCIIWNVQQQDVSSQTAMFYKGERVAERHYPSSENLAIDKESPRDHSLVVGVMSPNRFHISKINGIDVSVFKDNLLMMYVLKSNFTETNFSFPLYVEPLKLEFEEIPDPQKHPNLYKNFIEKKGIVNKNSLLLEGKNKLNTLLWEE